MPVTAQHPVTRWNRQAARELSFGVPEGWLDVDLAGAERDVAGMPPIAGVAQARLTGAHRVLVYRGSRVGEHESTYVLANLARLAAELENGEAAGSPLPLLVAGERAFLTRYSRLLGADGDAGPGTFTEVWVASPAGVPYRLVLSGPTADHDACMPFFVTMLAALRWDGA